MKNFNRFMTAAAMLAAVSFSSCDNEDEDGDVTPQPQSVVLNGSISEDMTLKAGDEIIIAGGVHVKAGATLTIEPGVVVKNDLDESVAYLLIERGAKIMAEGTADAPIVFTSDKEERGSWGGIIINGYAPINRGTEATAEVGDVMYGGSDADDNSGVIKYVRVEFGGNQINDEKEHNGFTFNGVGRGTEVHHLESYMGSDDGFEFFGGTVEANYLVSIGSGDDCFDWTYGWAGKGSNWFAQQMEGAGDRGIEADNNSKDRAASPYSNPTLENIVLIANEGSESDGMKLREGTKANINNVYIKNFKDAIEIEHNETLDNLANGEIILTNIKAEGQTNDLKYKGTILSEEDGYSAEEVEQSKLDAEPYETKAADNAAKISVDANVTLSTSLSSFEWAAGWTR
ncbi:hypothetical protein V6R21_24095 [Limibacter armeniacum]|uniref:hypothetical protein n=1 Tax=Limibacter armeniacum TaxID=466084 RepID=UPI002FE5A375